MTLFKTLINNFKGMKKKTQLKAVFQYLQTNTATASMVSKATGIKRTNICYCKRDLEKRGLLKKIANRKCRLTGCKAWFLTTNRDLFPKSKLKTTK